MKPLREIEANDLFFFYGSLLSGLDLSEELSLEDGSEVVGRGDTPGALVDLGGYPGLVDLEGRVVGEVVRIADLALARRIDRMERASGYVRRIRTIAGDSGVWEAWVYLYRGSWECGPPVSEGDWRAYRRGQ